MEKDLHELKRKIAVEATKIELLLYQLNSRKKLPPEEVEKRLQSIKEALFSISEDVIKSERYTASQLAARRYIPLFVTACIELGVAALLSQFDAIIAKFAALYVFSPLVSAVAGNYGLQVASKEIRAVAFSATASIWKLLLKETFAAILCGISLGLPLGSIAWLMCGNLLIIPVLTISLTMGVTTASVMGSLMPHIFHRLGLDPAFLVGPMETSLQDLASYFTFVASLLILSKLL